MDVAHKLFGKEWPKDLLDIALLGARHLLLFLLTFRLGCVKHFGIVILLIYRPEPFPGLKYEPLINRVSFFVFIFFVLSLKFLEQVELIRG